MEVDAPYFPGSCLPTASDCQHASTPPPPPTLAHQSEHQPESWGARGGSLPGAGAASSSATPGPSATASGAAGGASAARLSQSGQSSQAASLLGLNKPVPGGLATSLAGLLGPQPSDSSPSLGRSRAGGSISSGTSLRKMQEENVQKAKVQLYDTDIFERPK